MRRGIIVSCDKVSEGRWQLSRPRLGLAGRQLIWQAANDAIDRAEMMTLRAKAKIK